MFASYFMRSVKVVLPVLFFVLSNTNPVQAEGRPNGGGEVGSFTNDYIGDGHDRWRSGSYQRSFFSAGRQTEWADGIELRARAEIVTPWTTSSQPLGDAPYSTSLGAAIIAHNRVLGFDTRLGGELLLLGEASGLETIQSTFHDMLGMDRSFDTSRLDFQRIETGVGLGFEAEIGRVVAMGPDVMARPYLDATFGINESAGAGLDVVIGPLARAEVWTRDVVTGRLLTSEVNWIAGTSWIAGWDIRSVARSVHLPDHASVQLEPIQQRTRVGVQVSSDFANFFVGQAWLSSMFAGQSEPQRVGMLSIAYVF